MFDALGDGVAVGGVLGQDFNLDDFGDEVNVGLAGRREVALHSLSLKHQVKLDQVADRVSVYLYGVSFLRSLKTFS